MRNKDFFKNQSESSRIKANIVAEYFPQYSRILLRYPQAEIRYVDLFSGPGIYEDGKYSTPILVAQQCAADSNLREKVRLVFNDKKYGNALKENFEKIFRPDTFTKQPRFANKTVGSDKDIHNYLSKPAQKKNPTPTLLFFDPWGYKDIDTEILAKFLENWGNELFLFFNIKRINAAIQNGKFEALMRLLFPISFEKIRHSSKYSSTVYERLSLIIENIANEFQMLCKGTLYHTAFKFKEEDNRATSHFIIHFTKHPKGYALVKQIYYDFDNIGATLEKDGVYTFDAKEMGSSKLQFADMNVEILADDLERQFKGRELSARQVFDIHQTDNKFCASHYAKTLRKMVKDGKVIAKFTDDINHKVTVLINDNSIIKFL
jgi:three-Cys-motif partner protein